MEKYRLPEPTFVPQFEPPEDVERRIKNRENEDMNGPEWNWCGICCLRMVALTYADPSDRDDVPTMETMYWAAFDAGVFRMIDGAVVGAYHEPLATYARKELGFIRGWAVRGLSLDAVADQVYGPDPQYVIASVSSQIRNLTGASPETKSGHLVLVYGVETSEEGRFFLLHNSTGFASASTQRAVRVPEARFAECFSGNAIMVDNAPWRYTIGQLPDGSDDPDLCV